MLRGRQVGTVPEPPLFTGVRKKMIEEKRSKKMHVLWPFNFKAMLIIFGVRKKMTEEKRSKKIYVLWPFNFKVMLILYVVQNMYNKWPLTSNVLYRKCVLTV